MSYGTFITVRMQVGTATVQPLPQRATTGSRGSRREAVTTPLKGLTAYRLLCPRPRSFSGHSFGHQLRAKLAGNACGLVMSHRLAHRMAEDWVGH
jgi:hypothetical protein